MHKQEYPQDQYPIKPQNHLPSLSANPNPSPPSKPQPCIPFNSKDANQDHYRDNIHLISHFYPISRLGWKVADLQPDQQDLFIKCCNLLSSELIFPLNVFTNLIQYDEKYPHLKYPLKSLWVETTIHNAPESKEQIYENTSFPGGKVKQFCESVLLPSLRTFLKTHLNWQRLLDSGLDEYSILSLFQGEVIEPCNKWIEAIPPHCSKQ